MVDDVLNAAAAAGFTVVRTWASIDIGAQDDSNSTQGKADGVVYFQYWNGTEPAYNDGPDGLEHLDYAIFRAGQLGLKLVLPLVNNWRDFGGMDQYVRWINGQYHDQFYTEPSLRKWYKQWIAHLLNRTNIYTGIKYRNDPTILAWELGNEPRCISNGIYPSSGSCTPDTVTAWAHDISRFIRQVDPHHLIAAGDEGFYCTPDGTDFTEDCSQGVDTIALARLPNIDFMSYHLYPDGWGMSVDWGTEWIERHVADALALHKPAVLGEFGLLDQSIRNPTYKTWTDTVLQVGGAGSLFWLLAGADDYGRVYGDYDGFTIYCPSPICKMLGNSASMFRANRQLPFPPVADDDRAVTQMGTPVVLNPASNDVSYQGVPLVPGWLDLDPATRGRQTTRTVVGGSFVANADGTVLFTPAPNFAETIAADYVIRDALGRISNAASISVYVNTPGLLLSSFENGPDDWFALNGAGTTEQSADFHSLSGYSLKALVDPGEGDWFGALYYDRGIDLGQRTRLAFDIKTLDLGTSIGVAIATGDDWSWCHVTDFGYIDANITTTMSFDLLQLVDPDGAPCVVDLSRLHGVAIWLNGGASYYLDYVRAEN